MSSFNNLLSRAYLLSEAKVSPYAVAHPSFGKLTTPMSDRGLSSAPLHTMRFIREVLYYLDIITDEELNFLKKPATFSGKKQALLQMLRNKEKEINAKSGEIEERVSNTLDNFINEMMLRNEEKYVAQAAAKEVAKQMRQARSGKQMDDALTDIVSDESLLVNTAVARILADIQKNLGEPGFDIDEEALAEVIDYSSKINTLAALKSFIQQIANEPGYEKIAAYLSSAVKPISQGTEDEEMQEEAEDSVESYYDPSGAGVTPEEYDEVMADINDDGEVEGWEKGLAKKRGFENIPNEDEETVSENYTASYLTEQTKKDSVYKPKKTQNQSFRDRYKPKTSWQLEELRRYGM